MEKVKLDKIGLDPHYYPRRHGNADWMTVLKYRGILDANPKKADAKCTEKGVDPFPPVILVRRMKWDFPFMLIDGLHRYQAFRQYGLDGIWADVQRIPQSKWLEVAYRINHQRSHRNFDDGDIAWCAERMIADGVEPAKAAELLEITTERLEKIRTTRIEKISKSKADKLEKRGVVVHRSNGSRFVIKKAAITSVETPTDEALAVQAVMKSRNATAILDECIALFRSGAVDMKNEEHAARVAALKELITTVN